MSNPATFNITINLSDLGEFQENKKQKTKSNHLSELYSERIHITLTPEMKRDFKEACARNNTKMTFVVRDLIQAWIDTCQVRSKIQGIAIDPIIWSDNNK